MNSTVKTLLLSLVPTGVDFLLLIIAGFLSEELGIMSEDTAFTFVIVGTIIVAIVAYLLLGGLQIAFSAVIKAFQIGCLFPLFPIDLACGIILASCVLAIVWIFPVAAIALNLFATKIKVTQSDTTNTKEN